MVESTPRLPRLALHVFLVEDHQDTLECLHTYLEAMGYDVSTADTMEKAVAAMPSTDCDVLLTDICLADGNGWELLRTLQLYRPIYAIAMSGFCLGSERFRSQEAGFRHHLLKPFRPDQLDRLLQEAAQESQGENRRMH